MDDAGPQSLFVVVDYDHDAPFFGSIIQLESKVNDHEYAAHSTPEGRPQIKKSSSLCSLETLMNQKEYVAHFSQPHGLPWNPWVFSPPTSSTEDLYMFPYGGYGENKFGAPLRGSVFNLRTKMCKPPINPPNASKFRGPVETVTVKRHIYFMEHPYWYNSDRTPFFGRYNPDNDSWINLEPFPDHAIRLLKRLNPSNGYIVATAVWDGTILFNMDCCQIWAYNVKRNKWYCVVVKDPECYRIAGKAVVIENTIYALSTQWGNLPFNGVLALSIEREQIGGGDLVYKCSLCSKILVPGMGRTLYKSGDDALLRTRHLVHLGKDNFCLVQSCNHYVFCDYQPIQVTNIKLDGKNSSVTDRCLHYLKIVDCQQFVVRLCFSLPEYKTTAFKKGNRFVFELNPFPECFASKQKDKEILTLPKDDPLSNVQATSELDAKSNVASKASTVTGHPSHGYAKPSFAPKASTLGDGAASERSNTDEEGHSIYVRKLPLGATVRQLEKGLKKFGPIKRDGIQVGKNKKGKCFAYVEFESATSKLLAIEASTIRIGGCQAEILEKR